MECKTQLTKGGDDSYMPPFSSNGDLELQSFSGAVLQKSYFPYFSFPYSSMLKKIIPTEFQKITDTKLNNTP